jgi:NAD(P)-dependent dehydrogenase (short-subunit alcohol dehydrogenase family)
MTPFDLNHKVVLVTGGCGAIGQVIAATLAQHNARVAVNDLLAPDDALLALQTADATGPNVAYFQADAATPTGVQELLDRVTAHWEMPAVVCCHAGMVDAAPVQSYSLEAFDQLMHLNVRAAFILAQAAAQRWIETQQPGHLIFTTSWVQDVPWPEITPYTTSKAGMKAMMRGFARELASKQIRANAVAPGIVGAGMAKRQWDTDPSYRARAQKAIPLGYMQPPESVANAFLFLCSELANYMTGSVLLVDGGCSLYPMDE